MHRFAVLVSTLLFALGPPAHADLSASKLSNSEVRDILIKLSIAAYPGNCPCPYNVDRAGRRCGARSAYSKPGGRAPLCFAEDVTDEMIEEYRRRTS